MDLGYYTYIAAFTVSNNTLVNQQPTLHIIKLILQTLITEFTVHFFLCVFCINQRTPTCSKSKKEALVWVFLKKCLDPLAHPFISLVDEFLSEVAVYFLGSGLLIGWQCHIIEVRDLQFPRQLAMKVKHRRHDCLFISYLQTFD